MSEISSLSDQALLGKTRVLVREERELTARILHHLREVERRRLFVDLGYPSLFEYAVHDLHYSEASAQRRISAMRLLKELPELEPKVEAGSLSLSVLSQAQRFFRQEAKLEKPLDVQEKREVLAVLEGKSAREAEKELLSRSSEPVTLRPESVRPVSESHSELKFLATKETLEQLEKIRGLLGHTHSELSLGELVAVMAKITLEKLDPARVRRTEKLDPARPRRAERREAKSEANDPTNAQVKQVVSTAGIDSPLLATEGVWKVSWRQSLPTSEVTLVRKLSAHTSQKPTEASRYVKASLKREVWRRAKGRCQNCGSIHRLQIDHITPLAKGGSTTARNLRLLCFHCNQRQADLKIGRATMEGHRFLARLSKSPLR